MGGDRARPALVTGVQNSPELQLQVRLNVYRADTISPPPTSCLVQLDSSSPKLTLSATELPGATLGLGRAGQPQQHQLAPSSCSPELQAQGLKYFSPWSTLAGHSGSVLPQHSLATLGPGTAHSPYNTWQEDTFFPICFSQLPHNACRSCGNVRQRPPHCKLGWTVSEHREGTGCVSVAQAGKEWPALSPCCVTLLQGWPKASPRLQHVADWSPAISRHY